MYREMIISKLAPELFPSIQPSLEYLAEEVPVPIPSANSGYVCQFNCQSFLRDSYLKFVIPCK